MEKHRLAGHARGGSRSLVAWVHHGNAQMAQLCGRIGFLYVIRSSEIWPFYDTTNYCLFFNFWWGCGCKMCLYKKFFWTNLAAHVPNAPPLDPPQPWIQTGDKIFTTNVAHLKKIPYRLNVHKRSKNGKAETGNLGSFKMHQRSVDLYSRIVERKNVNT